MKNKWIVPVVVGGGIAAYFFSKKSSSGPSGPSAEELLNQAALNNEAFDALITDLSKNKPEMRKYLGTLLVTTTLKVSGLEKMFSSESTLKKKAMALAKSIQKVIPTECKGAPKLLSEPSMQFVDVDGGYKVVVKWMAQWSSDKKGPVKENVRACFERIVKSNKDVGDRVKGLTAVRL